MRRSWLASRVVAPYLWEVIGWGRSCEWEGRAPQSSRCTEKMERNRPTLWSVISRWAEARSTWPLPELPGSPHTGRQYFGAIVRCLLSARIVSFVLFHYCIIVYALYVNVYMRTLIVNTPTELWTYLLNLPACCLRQFVYCRAPYQLCKSYLSDTNYTVVGVTILLVNILRFRISSSL